MSTNLNELKTLELTKDELLDLKSALASYYYDLRADGCEASNIKKLYDYINSVYNK